MAGLVGYASSDEEEDVVVQQEPQQVPQQAVVQVAEPAAAQQDDTKAGLVHSEPDKGPSKVTASTTEPSAPQVPPQPMVGPLPQPAASLGPALPSMEDVSVIEAEDSQAPSSPYSANRTLIHNLTLPTVPNLDIPPSPPGSPSESTNKRFEQFLDLKRKGTHFNSKLEQSTALANPSLMDKLMAFVEIEAKAQYETTLSRDLWNPQALPEWASADSLRKTREKVVKEREAERASGGRSSVDFVSSSTQANAGISAPGGLSKGEKRKSGWK